MKKFLVSLVIALSIVGITTTTMPAGVVSADDIDGDGIDDGVTSSDDDSDTYETDYDSDVTVYEGDASDMDYTGSLDLYTGEPTGTSTTNTTTGRVSITDYCQYDYDYHYFCFPASGGTFYCSVADGMITTGEVTFAIGGEFNLAIYKDGAKLNGIPKAVSEPGSYTAITWDENSEKQLMSFQIVKRTTGKISQYVLPEGFSVSEVTIDGVTQPKSFGIVDMTQDGYYEIRYVCPATGITYTLVATMDHIPPQIVFEGVDKNDKAKGEVTLKGFQQGDTISVSLNDTKTSLKSGNKLTEPGQYRVVVYDEAGNTTVREFQIMLYFNIKSVFLLIAFVVLVAGVIVALYITRKNLRVR